MRILMSLSLKVIGLRATASRLWQREEGQRGLLSRLPPTGNIFARKSANISLNTLKHYTETRRTSMQIYLYANYLCGLSLTTPVTHSASGLTLC